MARAFVAYGVMLLLIGYFYFTTVLPLMPEHADEAEAAFALFMYMAFLGGLAFVQFGALPRVVAIRRREEGGERGGEEERAGAAAEEEEEEVEDDVPARGYEEEEKDDVPPEGHEKEE